MVRPLQARPVESHGCRSDLATNFATCTQNSINPTSQKLVPLLMAQEAVPHTSLKLDFLLQHNGTALLAVTLMPFNIHFQ
jgi:hypothetical protein